MKSLLQIYSEETTKFEDSCFEDGDGDKWPAPYFYKHAKIQKLKAEKVCLRHLSLLHLPWSGGSIQSIDDFIDHSIRVQNADTSIPIIIGWNGFVMDGWHRVCKAILEGKTHMKAYRFEKYLEPETEGSKG